MTDHRALFLLLLIGVGCGSEPTMRPPSTSPCEQVQAAVDTQEAFQFLLACTRLESGEQQRDLAVQALVELVRAERGFPMQHGDEVTFLYIAAPQWDQQDDRRTGESFDPSLRYGPISVIGPFNDWELDTGLSMTEEPQGLYHLTVPLSAVEGRGYRFVARDRANNGIRFSDPLSRRFDYDSDGRRSLIMGDGAQGHIEWVSTLPALALQRPRPLYVWVPPGYEQSDERYPVLYMHDGNNLFDRDQVQSSPGGTWDAHTIMSQQLERGHVRPAIIVGIPNSEARLDEYTHVVDERGSGPIGGEGDAYVDFLVDEVKPAVDARFRTLSDKAHTGIMGSSLGGLISYYAGYRHPELFGFVGGMSSTFGWGRIGRDGPSILDLYAELTDLPERAQVFYIDSGGGPAPACPRGDDNYCETVQMRDVLVSKGINRQPADPNATPLDPDLNLFWYWSEGAQHNEPNWRLRLHRPLRLFLGPQ